MLIFYLFSADYNLHPKAALESVFPQAELSAFIPSTRVAKEEKLFGLTQLVSGIRLFNKQLGKGGETIDNCRIWCVWWGRSFIFLILFLLVPELCANELQDITIIVGTMTTETEDFIQMYMCK